MEVFTSQKFRKKTEIAAEILDEEGNRLKDEERLHLEILEKRGETHRKIEAVTGGQCNIFRGTAFGDTGVAGYNDGQSHLREDVLDDYGFALHVKKHEDLHGAAMKEVALKKYLTADQIKALAEALKEPSISTINLMEGFTEMINIRANGKEQRCDYLKLEVPAAQRLENLALARTGRSLAAAFGTNNVSDFYCTLQRLSESLTEKKQSMLS